MDEEPDRVPITAVWIILKLTLGEDPAKIHRGHIFNTIRVGKVLYLMARDLGLKAAVLLESAARNHPLVDGTKRTSWTLMVLFLWLNGYRHDFSRDDAFDLVVGVAEGRLSLGDSSARIGARLVARTA
ncbi:type II toxin-antitoxin system death-on-curing family toxin [Pseudarthrobacter sulfonivorans]|uniref:type II toxin-antitoxin system death-on-curing family toxin n=1 Tax=Pseudarthrobacter sulfonivorans TaxID=121292 RepID=UPI0021069B97|nr:type II toxin-antitoxin system death-on-curing family toxin [Pseudarthrobacter sulfonivorans]